MFGEAVPRRPLFLFVIFVAEVAITMIIAQQEIMGQKAENSAEFIADNIRRWTEGFDMLCILGPTASGKTRFAVEAARAFNNLQNNGGGADSAGTAAVGAEIISADSRQVYRDMNIGTGKDLGEYAEVPYHLIDIADAGEKYNLFRYKSDFQSVYNEMVARRAFPILCGGSGLYIEAACKGYELKEVAPDPVLRSRLEKLEMPKLVQMLTELKSRNGSEPHNNTDFDSKKRVIRAIEIEKAAVADASAAGAVNANTAAAKVKYIGLNPDRETRNSRINRRLQERLDSGMVEEVKALLDRGIPAEDLIYYGLEYKFITQYLKGDTTYDWMKEHLAIAIHQFAKRQMTWFRGMERRGTEIEWI